MLRSGLGIHFGLLLLMQGCLLMQAAVVGEMSRRAAAEFPPGPGRPLPEGRRPVGPRPPVRRPTATCTCDNARLDQMKNNIQDLLNRMNAEETRSTQHAAVAKALERNLRATVGSAESC